MYMTPKQTALVQVFKIIGLAAIIGSICGMLISLFSLQQVAWGLMILALLFLIKMVYDIELSKAENLAKLNEISQK